MGGRCPRPSPERADVHVLALPAESMAAKRGPADRPCAAEPSCRRPHSGGRCRPRGPRSAWRQRPCASLGGAVRSEWKATTAASGWQIVILIAWPRTDRAHSRPLLVIDGDSFAHRAYHALPKTIRREDGGGAGAKILLFIH